MLADAGFTHALLAPPVPAALRATVEEILSGKLDDDIAELPAAAPRRSPQPGTRECRSLRCARLVASAASAARCRKKAVPPVPKPRGKARPGSGKNSAASPPELHDEAAHLVAAEDARLQSRLASQAAPAKPAAAPKAAPQPCRASSRARKPCAGSGTPCADAPGCPGSGAGFSG